MSYRDYAEKYLLKNGMLTLDDIKYETGLYSLADYLTHADNYKIYQSFDDYFINKNQLARLKTLAGKHLVCLNCGAHLGFLYRKECIDAIKNDIGG